MINNKIKTSASAILLQVLYLNLLEPSHEFILKDIII